MKLPEQFTPKLVTVFREGYGWADLFNPSVSMINNTSDGIVRGDGFGVHFLGQGRQLVESGASLYSRIRVIRTRVRQYSIAHARSRRHGSKKKNKKQKLEKTATTTTNEVFLREDLIMYRLFIL